jgi:hypothetical protein
LTDSSYRSSLETLKITRAGSRLLIASAIGFFLFKDSGDQSVIVASLDWLLRLPHICILSICPGAYFLINRYGHNIQQGMETNEDGFGGIIADLAWHFVSVDVVLSAVLIMAAFPIPASADLAVFRILAASLAGFILVYGRKAAQYPRLRS